MRIYTIGYLEFTPNQLIEALKGHRIKNLLDVRYNPMSRKPGFSKGPLRRLCVEHGIAYHHFRSLGVPPDERRPLDPVATLYRYRGLIRAKDAEMKGLIELVCWRPSALMCCEADPIQCHRRVLAEALAEALGLSVYHIREVDK
jgi:uncharacterized protein (DUF488 family)